MLNSLHLSSYFDFPHVGLLLKFFKNNLTKEDLQVHKLYGS